MALCAPAGKKRRLTLIERGNDINSMMDIGKIADLVCICCVCVCVCTVCVCVCTCACMYMYARAHVCVCVCVDALLINVQ